MGGGTVGALERYVKDGPLSGSSELEERHVGMQVGKRRNFAEPKIQKILIWEKFR